jgi:hypothetical protein
MSEPTTAKQANFLEKHWKTLVVVLISVAAVALATNSIVAYEGKRVKTPTGDKPIPTLTGDTIWPISSQQEALQSNNDLIVVITPVADAALNTMAINIANQAASQIRNTDRIYVGLFMLPVNEANSYPAVYVRLLGEGRESSLYGATIRSDLTQDKIFDIYLSRKYLR